MVLPDEILQHYTVLVQVYALDVFAFEKLDSSVLSAKTGIVYRYMYNYLLHSHKINFFTQGYSVRSEACRAKVHCNPW